MTLPHSTTVTTENQTALPTASLAASSPEELQNAFNVFNQVSTELGSYFRMLESKVDKLNRELVASRSERIRELTEKEKLAAKLSSLMDALPAGLVVLDPNFIVLQENPQAVELLGKSLIGGDWRELVTRPNFSEPVLSGEFEHENGKRLSISHSQFGNGKETILLITDVTESFELANRINREERLAALGEMAARLAHQIRTPLTTAILYVSHLSGKHHLGQGEADKVPKILDRLRQVERQVEGMLSYIRGDAVEHEVFCLRELLQEVKEATLAQVEAQNGTLLLNIQTGITEFQGDREALLNAVSNLVENSLQATFDSDIQPIISVSLDYSDKSFCIKVKDNGPGFSSALAERMFDPFFSTKNSGNGLGLAVVMSTINAHNGSVKSRNLPEGGAAIELRLPVTDESQMACESPTRPSPQITATDKYNQGPTDEQ